MIRTRVTLNGEWDFFPDAQQQLEAAHLESAGPPRTIAVPGPWQAQFEDLRTSGGVAWYRRTFSVTKDQRPETETNRTEFPVYILHFGAVDYHATVWLNGQLLGAHEGGYLPFELPCDSLSLDAPNELVVRVVDPSDDSDVFSAFPFDEIPHGKQSWYGPIGGIWQGVYLEARHATYITRLQITPDLPGERAEVTVYLNQPANQRYGLRCVLTDPNGQVSLHHFALEVGAQQAQINVPVPDPLLWDTRSPHLYHLEAVLTEFGDESTAFDSLGSTFGMRTITTSPDGHLMLNGRVLYLRGALDQDYYPKLIYTPFSDAELDDQFAKAKHMGLNCLRTHIKITDPRYYDAADRAGLLIWTELPNWNNLTLDAQRRGLETLTGMVERDWNHPSIIIWTIINEGWGVDLAGNESHRVWLAETYAYLKRLDPHRLVVGNSACFGNFHVVTDIEDFHNYYAVPDHYRTWRDWVETFASRPSWTFAHNYENIESWRAFMRDPWNRQPRVPAREVERKGNEPMVVSEFGNWGLPDVAKLREGYGGEPWWFETGMEWGDGVVYPHGIEQRFANFHLNKVFPTLSDLAAASQRMQFTALKYEIEQMRRHPSIVGYVITEFTDVHWESNGLLDMCRNPKAFHDVIAQINSADAIVPDWERVAFWEGERSEVHLSLSHFSTTDLQDCRLEWNLDMFPQVRGFIENLTPKLAQITDLGVVSFVVPPLSQSARVRLELRLYDAAGELVTSNHHEFYAFPRHLAIPQRADALLCAPGNPALSEQLAAFGYCVTDDLAVADVAVVEIMTDAMRGYMQQGGRVVWLAEQPHTLQTHLGGLDIIPRRGKSWQGDWASSFSWLRQDRMFRDIPTGGMVDFAFADMTPEQVITGLSPRDFSADVHAGLFVGWLHHIVGLVAERRIGAGRLLVSTFRLRDHLDSSPVARVMLDDMLTHVLRSLAKKVEEPAAVLA